MTSTGEPASLSEILNPLTSLTMNAIQAEALRAHCRHAGHSLLSKQMTNTERLAILVEEVGEVAHALTHDGDKDNLETELIQVAAVAASWIEVLTTR